MADKRSYTINSFKGVDLSSSPVNVASYRASYMCNMISRSGVNHKRNGWNEIANFYDVDGRPKQINGIYDYLDIKTNEKYIIVHAENAFYKCTTDFRMKEKIESSANIIDTKSRAYYKNGLLWIVGCGDFCVYNGNEIVRVKDSCYAYIPVTSIGIAVEGKLDRLELSNLLTNRRKNKIIGKGHTQFFLDNEISKEHPVYVDIRCIPNGFSLKLEDNTIVTEKEIIVKYEIDLGSISENEDYIFYASTGSCYQNDILSEGNIVDKDGNEISLPIVVYNTERDGNVRGVFATLFDASPLFEGESNITVEYTANYDSELELSASCVMPCYGQEVLLAVHKNNVLCFSDVISPGAEHGFGYFPIDNYVVVGNDKEKITAVIPLGDSSVGVFKKNSFYRVNFTLQTKSETQEAEMLAQIIESFDSVGCINQDVAINVNADTMVLNRNGVFGVEFNTNSRSLKMRSSFVNKEITAYSQEILNEAIACEHEGRYYLFIAGKVYIADSRFKVYESNRLDTSFEYEWWVWDNCHARVACSIDGRLYMGRENGRIAVFDNEYTDRSRVTLTNGDGDLAVSVMPRSRSVFAFNTALGVKEGDKVKIENAYSVIGCFKTERVQDKGVKIVISDEALIKLGIIYVGAYVYFESDATPVSYEITDIEFSNGEYCAYIDASKCNEEETLFVSTLDKEYILRKEINGYSLIEESYTGFEAPPAYCYACVTHFTNLRVVLFCNDKNVECELHTAVLSLGTEIHTKSLWKIAITVSQDTVGEVLVGYQTNVNNVIISRNVARKFDFENLDFKAFTFESGFYKSYVKRMFERNFNYIGFKVASRSNKDFALEQLTFVYSVNGVLKGDR